MPMIPFQDDHGLLSRARPAPVSDNSSNHESSFRVLYYGGSVTVPFLWESRPGTPKHPSACSPPPPLTPPPSYQSATPAASRNKSKTIKHSRNLKSVFSKALVVPSRKINAVSPPSLFSSSSSSTSTFSSSYSASASAPETPYNAARKNDGLTATCFGGRGSRVYCYSPMRSVKKAVLAIVGH